MGVPRRHERLVNRARQRTRRLVNGALAHTIGFELCRPPGHRKWRMPAARRERMLAAPVFIFCSPRSGSTLLRVILGSHSQLYAPPELPLIQLTVRAETRWIQASLEALRLTTEDVENMLWDRLLADALARSGKPTVVVKTPANVLLWRRIAEIWPDARFIFLLRHPAAVVASLCQSWDPDWHAGRAGGLNEIIGYSLRYMSQVEEARGALPGLTVRYEELTADPAGVARRVCEFLGVAFEPVMLEYGKFDNHFATGLGDVSANIRSGRVQAAAPAPQASEIPEALKEMCTAWGYLGPAPGDAPAEPPEPAPDHAPVEAASNSPMPQRP
jgi:sulfotransferase family protein